MPANSQPNGTSMTSTAPTLPDLSDEEMRAGLRHILELETPPLKVTAEHALLDNLVPKNGPPMFTGSSNETRKLVDGFLGFFQRRVKDESALIIDHLSGWNTGVDAVTHVTVVFRERVDALMEETRAQWAQRVTKQLMARPGGSENTILVASAEEGRQWLDDAMASSRIWLRKDLRSNVRTEMSRRSADELARAANRASQQSARSAITIAKQGRWTALFAGVAALSAIVTAVIYLEQLSVARDQLLATKAQVLLQKCAANEVHRELVENMPCPAVAEPASVQTTQGATTTPGRSIGSHSKF